MKRSATCQAIDIWMGTCTAFVFFALVEFTFVNYTWRTRGRLPGIPSYGDREYLHTSQSNGDQNRNLLNLEEVKLEINFTWTLLSPQLYFVLGGKVSQKTVDVETIKRQSSTF